MKSFKFRLNDDLVLKVGYDIEYEAKKSKESKDLFEVWFQEPGEQECYVIYEKKKVAECIADGSWLVQ